MEAALARAAESRTRNAETPPDIQPDGPASDDQGADTEEPATVDVAAVEARVVRARHRRAVVGWTAAGVTSAAVVALVLTALLGPSAAGPTVTDASPTAVPLTSSPCGTSSGTTLPDDGARTLPVSLTSQTEVLTPGATWVGTVIAGAAPPDDTTVDLGRLAPRPLLLRDGVVVGTAADPASPLAEGPSFAEAPFAPCPGASLAPGTYEVVVDQPVQVGGATYRVVSNTVPVHVVTAKPAGYRPAWLDGSPIACGSTLEDLGVRAGGTTPARLLVDSAYVDATGITWAFRNPGAADVTYSGNRELGLLWLQDGVVRSVGHDLSPSDGTVTVHGQTTLRLSARWDTTDYCRPAADGRTYPHHLPAGAYEVYVYARITPPSDLPDSTAWFVQTTGPTYVRVDAHGAVLGR
ncbi:hypothetical protein GCM10025864_07710 [Luteimicrobium album]|uniref:PKD domain-containing protein n=1 Tax=Luteimicrobium album TaxID=1054550 RepID=A0ABQ6HYE4_9MICO|nr:hypothetical protein [Luteimicrobium album]GMA23012.1 hypothetical protein GCM10025864_07710 [Luteimicrobium album]